jgi:hypothetical protein
VENFIMNQKLPVQSQSLQVRGETLPVSNHSTELARSATSLLALVESGPVQRALGRSRWAVRLWAVRIGPLGRLGLGFAALGAVLYLAAVLPSRSDVSRAEEEVSSLQDKIRGEVERSAQMPFGPAEELDRFYMFIPPDSELSNSLRKVHQISAKQGLQLEQAEYRVAAEGPGHVLRYEVAFPVLGTYPQIRRFLRQVSDEIPSSVTDKVSFEYQKGNSDRVRARISLLLYARKES